MAKIVGFDSSFDESSQIVAKWRQSNVYPKFTAKGHDVKILSGSLANRLYLSQELLVDGVRFLSASGHGVYDEFKGSDGSAALRVGNYKPEEVTPKVIHLLSCYTAYRLGPEVVKNGCASFIGYDVPFTFTETYVDDFMAPDAELDEALSNGHDVAKAVERMMEVYDEKIEKLINAGALSEAAIMQSNKDHVCCAVKDGQWGSTTAKI